MRLLTERQVSFQAEAVAIIKLKKKKKEIWLICDEKTTNYKAHPNEYLTGCEGKTVGCWKFLA